MKSARRKEQHNIVIKNNKILLFTQGAEGPKGEPVNNLLFYVVHNAKLPFTSILLQELEINIYYENIK